MPHRITMHPVKSSHIESVGHDGGRELHVVYKGGKRYTYDVPFAKFEEVKGAESVGKAVRQLGKGTVWEPPK